MSNDSLDISGEVSDHSISSIEAREKRNVNLNLSEQSSSQRCIVNSYNTTVLYPIYMTQSVQYRFPNLMRRKTMQLFLNVPNELVYAFL